jgi:phosphoglycolate phosphatase-like HAD superfamily hydrolase
MAAMVGGQGLGELTDWQFCLASPGVDTKADMLRAAMQVAGTAAAVMVGDRDSDRLAAVAVGIPFYWRRNDLCDLSDADGVWDGDPRQLITLLGRDGISLGGSE